MSNIAMHYGIERLKQLNLHVLKYIRQRDSDINV